MNNLTTFNESAWLKSIGAGQNTKKYYFRKTKEVFSTEDIFYDEKLYVSAYDQDEINSLFIEFCPHLDWRLEVLITKTNCTATFTYGKCAAFTAAGKTELESKIKLLKILNLKIIFKLKPKSNGKKEKAGNPGTTGKKNVS
jgi:hypothetical protein